MYCLGFGWTGTRCSKFVYEFKAFETGYQE